MRNYLIILFCALSLMSSAQTLTPQVLNSAGGERTGGGLILHDNVGEPFVATVGASLNLITEGFLQPDTMSLKGIFTLSATIQQPQCLDKANEGYISLSLGSSVSNYTPTYIWSSGVCPGNNCTTADSLNPGVYSVTVVIRYVSRGLNLEDTVFSGPITVESPSQPCLIRIYSGVTPNNDGVNDVLIIDNLDLFPDNHVWIYNRWGKLLYEQKNYDHRDRSRSWPSDEQKNSLVASTYFYVIELGGGKKPVKGWVELIKD